jgi:hypothetical protein
MRVRLKSSRLQTDLLPKLSSKTILLPNVQLVNQLASREGRTLRGGRKRSTIAGTHGDVVVGVARCAINRHAVEMTELRL